MLDQVASQIGDVPIHWGYCLQTYDRLYPNQRFIDFQVVSSRIAEIHVLHALEQLGCKTVPFDTYAKGGVTVDHAPEDTFVRTPERNFGLDGLVVIDNNVVCVEVGLSEKETFEGLQHISKLTWSYVMPRVTNIARVFDSDPSLLVVLSPVQKSRIQHQPPCVRVGFFYDQREAFEQELISYIRG